VNPQFTFNFNTAGAQDYAALNTNGNPTFGAFNGYCSNSQYNVHFAVEQIRNLQMTGAGGATTFQNLQYGY
jgi:hypothetical protein